MSLLRKIAGFFSTVRPQISDRVRPYFDDREHRDLITKKVIELRSSNYKGRSIKYQYKNKNYEIKSVLP